MKRLFLIGGIILYATQSFSATGTFRAPATGSIHYNCHFGEECASKNNGRHAGVDYLKSTNDGKVYMTAPGRIIKIIENDGNDHGLGNTVVA